MKLTGNCLTTAMGIMPHTDVDRALELAFSLDIPFWPQLPKVSFLEDMYAQATENFPGIRLDVEKQRVLFSTDLFYEELTAYAERCGDESTFALSPGYSPVYHRFLARDLTGYRHVRGQYIGPISFGLKVVDENKKPIIYNDEAREFLFDFLAQKVNAQYRQLRALNPGAFVWLDEPGLELLFSAFTGYPAERAREDMNRFLSQLEGPRGIHLCGNPDWSFLLEGLDLDILSLDVYACGFIFSRYVDGIRDFLARGGIISWGITPTLTEELSGEDLSTLASKLEETWAYLAGRGIDREQVVRQAWIAPARCCLVNADGVETVERSFTFLRRLAALVRRRYHLGGAGTDLLPSSHAAQPG